jgi:hypothetical protein
MKLSRKVYATRSEKALDFILGFLGWFVLNGVLGGALQLVSAAINWAAGQAGIDTAGNLYLTAGLVVYGLLFLVEVAVIILFAFTRTWIALGALAAIALGLFITICLAVLIGGACFVLLGGLNRSGGALIGPVLHFMLR